MFWQFNGLEGYDSREGVARLGFTKPGGVGVNDGVKRWIYQLILYHALIP